MSAAISIEPVTAAEALVAAEAFHDAAVTHLDTMRKAASEARCAADEARAAARAMVDAAAAGTSGLDAAKHATADRLAERLGRAAEIAEAIATGALRNKERAHLDLLGAQSKNYRATFTANALREIAAAERVDHLYAEFRKGLQEFIGCAEVTSRSSVAACRFDDALPAAMAGNEAAKKLHPSEYPRTRIEERGATAAVAAPLVWIDSNQHSHTLNGSFAGWRAALLQTLLGPRPDLSSGRMQPSVNILGRSYR